MSSVFSADIYEIAETVNEIQKQYIPVDDKTRSVGLMGYLNDIESTQIQNAVITASEMANEMWPARAKFEKNVIAHAIIQNIVDINAVPSRIQIYIGIEEMQLENLLTNDQFVIDKDSAFYIGDLEYHLPYDLVITRNLVLNNQKVFTARYRIDRDNELVPDLTNPYLQAPFIQIYQTQRYVMVKCMLLQVEHESVTERLLTTSPIENKTLDFTFENQLASFVVKVTENGETTYLTPIFEGIGVYQDIKNFCYYIYEDITDIRIRFDSLSYMPSLNAEIEVMITTTHGEQGNFEYEQSFFASITSEKYGYNNISLFVIPASDSEGGRDRKSVEELQRLLPKEALSRGSIANMQDLINYFQMLDNDYARMSFQKKVDNQFERTYYSYLVLKDRFNNVVPTNTLNLMVSKDTGFDTHDNRKRALKTGCAIKYSRDMEYAEILDRDQVDAYLAEDPNNHFVYTTPFTVVVTDDPLYVSYYLTIMNYPALTDFTYINELCPVQFICTSVNWKRSYSVDPDLYKLDFSLLQNIAADSGIVIVDDEGKITENNLKAVAVFYNSGTYDDASKPYRYMYCDMSGFDITKEFTFDFHMQIRTDDKINDDAKIKVFDMYVPGTTVQDYGYLSDTVKVRIYILAKLKENGEVVNYGRHDLDDIIPEGLEDFTVTNMYEVVNGLNMYVNFSDVVRSTVTAEEIEHEYEIENCFLIDSVPLIKRSYGDDETNIQAFVDMLNDRKSYIDRGVYLLENNFLVDFKLFNTYGPSRIYSLDEYGKEIVDRINITLNFEIKIVKASDSYTKEYIMRDIKEMIEDLNDMTNLHIPNLITEITNKYYPYSIEYIEFLGFNDYGPGEQHLYRQEYDDVTIVPEFICCSTKDDLTPDINIRVV